MLLFPGCGLDAEAKPALPVHRIGVRGQSERANSMPERQQQMRARQLTPTYACTTTSLSVQTDRDAKHALDVFFMGKFYLLFWPPQMDESNNTKCRIRK
jgi:hypothetical protein